MHTPPPPPPPPPQPAVESHPAEIAQYLEESPHSSLANNGRVQRPRNKEYIRRPSAEASDEGQGQLHTSRRVLNSSPLPAIDDFFLPSEYDHSSLDLDRILPHEFYEPDDCETEGYGRHRRRGSSRTVLDPSHISAVNDVRLLPEYDDSSLDIYRILPQDFYEIDDSETEGYGRHHRWRSSNRVLDPSHSSAINDVRLPPEYEQRSHDLGRALPRREFYEIEDSETEGADGYGMHRRWDSSRRAFDSSHISPTDDVHLPPEYYYQSFADIDRILPPEEFYQIDDTETEGACCCGM
jgi:hypothetical protein